MAQPPSYTNHLFTVMYYQRGEFLGSGLFNWYRCIHWNKRWTRHRIRRGNIYVTKYLFQNIVQNNSVQFWQDCGIMSFLLITGTIKTKSSLGKGPFTLQGRLSIRYRHFRVCNVLYSCNCLITYLLGRNKCYKLQLNSYMLQIRETSAGWRPTLCSNLSSSWKIFSWYVQKCNCSRDGLEMGTKTWM